MRTSSPWLHNLVLSTLLWGASPGTAQEFDHTHARWTSQLVEFVQNGRVSYGDWKQSASPRLDAYLAHLASVEPTSYATWDRPQQLAYWINAYNAAMIRLVLDHHPLESVRDIGFLPFAVFRKDVATFAVAGDKPISLNHIEHEILRKQFDEPRIHFAIVCASIGCPGLRQKAYEPANLDAQLDEAARAFVRDPTKNRFDGTTGILHLSSIFDWFKEDFVGPDGSMTDYIARFSAEGSEIRSRDKEITILWNNYDWNLNGD